ncbi:DUF421 domain-containing protein [Larkinella insperata]|uniref:DUF421 domain-containing protein n=1 Tax=Larkinella insperata TaxID=332158 RepID=A0ABW3QGP0_9BACT
MQQLEYLQIDDWLRIFFGTTSPNFLIEAVFRSFFLYLVLIVSMRLMGKRMSNQLSRNEMAAMVSLAAAVGVPMLDAHRGLLASVAIAVVIVGIQQLIAYFAFRNEQFEKITQDTPTILVKNGVLQYPGLQETLVTRERLFAQLRSSSLEHLGQVKRLIMEANGKFTLIEEEKPRPGLPLHPMWDSKFVPQYSKTSGQSVCRKCGNAKQKSEEQDETCTNCGNQNWVGSLA